MHIKVPHVLFFCNLIPLVTIQSCDSIIDPCYAKLEHMFQNQHHTELNKT